MQQTEPVQLWRSVTLAVNLPSLLVTPNLSAKGARCKAELRQCLQVIQIMVLLPSENVQSGPRGLWESAAHGPA